MGRGLDRGVAGVHVTLTAGQENGVVRDVDQQGVLVHAAVRGEDSVNGGFEIASLAGRRAFGSGDPPELIRGQRADGPDDRFAGDLEPVDDFLGPMEHRQVLRQLPLHGRGNRPFQRHHAVDGVDINPRGADPLVHQQSRLDRAGQRRVLDHAHGSVLRG